MKVGSWLVFSRHAGPEPTRSFAPDHNQRSRPSTRLTSSGFLVKQATI